MPLVTVFSAWALPSRGVTLGPRLGPVGLVLYYVTGRLHRRGAFRQLRPIGQRRVFHRQHDYVALFRKRVGGGRLSV